MTIRTPYPITIPVFGSMSYATPDQTAQKMTPTKIPLGAKIIGGSMTIKTAFTSVGTPTIIFRIAHQTGGATDYGQYTLTSLAAGTVVKLDPAHLNFALTDNRDIYFWIYLGGATAGEVFAEMTFAVSKPFWI